MEIKLGSIQWFGNHQNLLFETTKESLKNKSVLYWHSRKLRHSRELHIKLTKKWNWQWVVKVIRREPQQLWVLHVAWAFVVHPGLQMPTYFFYNNWHSVSFLGLHTNFGVGAASWSYFPHFLGFLWMKQSEFFPGVAVGILPSGYIFSLLPQSWMVLDKRTHFWSFPL